NNTVSATATTDPSAPTSTKAQRQPTIAPIQAANGTPSTTATDTPPNASVSALGRSSGWATRATTTASSAQNTPMAIPANSLDANRTGRLGAIADVAADTKTSSSADTRARRRSSRPMSVGVSTATAPASTPGMVTVSPTTPLLSPRSSPISVSTPIG